MLVVGGGPAGSATALLLARRGWDVAVLERSAFPRPKPCGECLNPGAVAALRRLGLLDAVEALDPAPIEGWQVRSGKTLGAARFPRWSGHGLALPRALLDHALLGRARDGGVRVEHGVTVRAVGEPRDGTRTLRVREPDGTAGVRSARFVVGADGLRSVVGSALGGARRRPRLRKLSLTLRVRGRRERPGLGLLVLEGDVTVGVAPVDAEGSLWNLTVVADARRWGRVVAGDPLGFALAASRRALGDWAGGAEVTGGPWASGPFDRPVRAVAGRGLALVGDAAGYYDPLTGQGIYRALRSAELAAPAIDRALRAGRVSGALGGYRLRRAAAFTTGGWVQRLVEQALAREGLREPLVRRLASRPQALSRLFAVTGDAAPCLHLLHPDLMGSLILPVPPGGAGRSSGDDD